MSVARPKDFDSVAYLLEILRHIPKKRKITSTELHQQLKEAGFERDIRSIQRALVSLCTQFDIECDNSTRPHGYCWKEQAVGINMPILTTQQALVLMLAEQQLDHLLPSNILATMKPFFEYAKHKLMFDAKGKSEAQWLDKVGIAPTSQPLLPAPISDEIFATISTALYENRYLNIRYKNQAGEEKSGRVMPLALVPQGASIYLVVRYEGFDNTRHLALHRFISAELSTMHFERPKDFNLKKYIANAHFGFSKGQKIELHFCIAHNVGFHLTETKLSVDQEMTDFGDHYAVKATLVDSEMLDWWLAHFGENVWNIEKKPIG